MRFWQESGKDGVPLDPDWDALLRMTAMGTLKVVTIRFEERLVGFILNVVMPTLFYKSTIHGTTIAVWIEPAYRIGWFPIRLLRQNVEYLKGWGCRRLFIAADVGYKEGRMASIFRRIGYELHETTYKMVT